jgi:dephospho-CoA kinase
VGELWADPASATALCGVLGLPYPIDRDAMRARLIDPDFREGVANALHPFVVERLESMQPQVVEIPLLFEACLQSVAQNIVVTDCPVELQLKRLTERLGSEEKARNLLATQLPNAVRIAFANWVVDTQNDLSSTYRQVDKVVASLGFHLADADQC